MGKTKGTGYDGKGFDSRNGAIDKATPGNPVSVPGIALLTSTSEEIDAGCTALSYLLLRDDGWLRAIPGEDGKMLYLKWKYTRGPHAGHYVMSRVNIGDWPWGMRLLFGKVVAVESGGLRPSKDTPYTD